MPSAARGRRGRPLCAAVARRPIVRHSD